MDQHNTSKKKMFPSPELSVQSAKEQFEEYSYSTFAQEMRLWEKTICNDIYALSFFIVVN